MSGPPGSELPGRGSSSGPMRPPTTAPWPEILAPWLWKSGSRTTKLPIQQTQASFRCAGAPHDLASGLSHGTECRSTIPLCERPRTKRCNDRTKVSSFTRQGSEADKQIEAGSSARREGEAQRAARRPTGPSAPASSGCRRCSGADACTPCPMHSDQCISDLPRGLGGHTATEQPSALPAASATLTLASSFGSVH